MHSLHRAIPVLALLAASLAQAAPPSAASAELTAFKTQLTDLTPDDGIAPALTISQGGHVLAGLQTDVKWLNADTYIDQRLALDTFASPPPLGDAAVALSLGQFQGSASRSGDGLFAATTGEDGWITGSYAWWETYKTIAPLPEQNYPWTGSFLLGAGTALTLTAEYRAFASVTAGQAVIANVGLYGLVGSAGMDQLRSDQAHASLATPGEQTHIGTLMLTLSNPSATAVAVYFGAGVSAYSQPVPEPGTLALLLAGGLLVAWCARHRR